MKTSIKFSIEQTTQSIHVTEVIYTDATKNCTHFSVKNLVCGESLNQLGDLMQKKG